ncbi:MAG TPA: methyltransferase domain-containing protein [Gemmatimonadales bacterium]|jgi:SAM-dependent methyltransferase|nr:methyltransferase domain-containing protein [Gemmatimonadales bacterium]
MSRTVYELTHCPVCDAPDGLEIADAEAMRAEVQALGAFHERRLRAGTPPEYLTDRLAFSQYPPLRLAQCRSCTHIYRNPRERREALAEAYQAAGPDEVVLRELFEVQRAVSRTRLRRLTALTGHSGRGLEVGSYAGGFLAAAAAAGWTFEGVDVNPKAQEFAARQGLRVTRGEISDVEAEPAFDVVAIWNTFEQLYDARSAVVAAGRLLKPGGILAVRFPNGAFYARWRRRLRGPLSDIAIRLLGHNNLLSFPYRQGFTRSSLAVLLGKCRFEIVAVIGDTLVPVADRWTTVYGALEERLIKRLQRLLQPGWQAPWVEVYARKD